MWGSDHRPILARISWNTNTPKRFFKFDKRWIGKDGFKEAIKTGWEISEDLEPKDLHNRIVNCRNSISRWKRANPSNAAKMIETIKQQLESAQVDDNISNEAVLELK